MNDLTTITISLEGSYANAEMVNIPLDNLALVGEPWVSSEFAWINGDVVRRKVFRYRARPLLPGAARVGPIVLTSGDGQRDTLPLVNLQVEPDRMAATNDPEAVLRELMATGKPLLFMVAEASKRDVWVGEQVIVTWFLYNAATVENWQIVSVPKLTEFWSEEQEARSSDAERVWVGDKLMQRVRMRRVALYPLRGGALEVGSMSVEAGVMERLRGPFSIFEGNLVETTFSSAPIAINVKPLPPGLPVDAVGELTLTCDPPNQRNGGPVVVEATLSGNGNLRGASPPRFTRAVAGNVQVEGGETTVTREEGAVAMSRKWRFLIFPSTSGALTVPALTMTTFSPSVGARKTLRCEEQILGNAAVSAADGVVRASGAPEGGDTPEARTTPVLTFTLGGLSKSAGLPHFKLAWIRVSGPGKREALEALELIADNFLSVATPVQVALPDLLRIAPRIRDSIRARTRANLDTLRATNMPSAQVLPVEGGWSAVIRVPRVMPDEDFALALLDRGVLVQPGYFFDFPEGYLVVSLLTREDVFAEGVARVAEMVAL